MPGIALPGVLSGGAVTLQQQPAKQLTSPVVEAAKPLQERQVEKVANLVTHQNPVGVGVGG